MDLSKIKPMKDWIAVSIVKEDKSPGGLYIDPDAVAKDRGFDIGIVKAVGNSQKDIHVGDKVALRLVHGSEITDTEIIYSPDQVLGIVED